jgi:hypothetical protein
MSATSKFRLLAFAIFVFVGGISTANLMAELLRPASASQPSRSPASPDEVSSAGRASAIVPFRSDLMADYAVALASQVPASGQASQGDQVNAAQETARRALGIGPHDSRLWLVLALIEARRNPADPRVAEALKMSYLTGPGRVELIPARLRSATSNNALNDSDLSELARGDVRAILTQLPDQRSSLVNDYARASETGRAFLRESVNMLDPKFVDALQGAK